ncbi:MAG TPA: DUF6680 family protein [candidate division Zixibacteria bacterium]|nr:DUF6680 family protein [candidate division Zixibacteria bacterium]
MDIFSVAIVVATLLGPILAVQAQKAVERARERHNRKAWVFHTLMATRAARLSTDHVQALNMIDLVFYGRRILGIHRRRKTESTVLDAWHEYLDHLNTKYEKETLSLWAAKGDELFVNLLFALAVDVGFRFDRVQLMKGAYSPIAHGELELEQQQLRKFAIDLLSGGRPLKMEVTGFPIHEEALKSQLDVQAKLAAALEGRGRLSVEVVPKAGPNKALQ